MIDFAKPDPVPPEQTWKVSCVGSVTPRVLLALDTDLGPGLLRCTKHDYDPVFRSLWHRFKCWMGWDKPLYYQITMQFLFTPEQHSEECIS